MSSLNLKVRVKNGELTPGEAIVLLLGDAEDKESARNSKTGRWLASPNAQKRYKEGRKSHES